MELNEKIVDSNFDSDVVIRELRKADLKERKKNSVGYIALVHALIASLVSNYTNNDTFFLICQVITFGFSIVALIMFLEELKIRLYKKQNYEEWMRILTYKKINESIALNKEDQDKNESAENISINDIDLEALKKSLN